jgi:hypothetical protein
LVEYRASKKDNVFRDRRFGEDDPTLSLEEKMLLRFQKERQRRARASGGGAGRSGRFNLEEGDDEEYEEDEEYGGLRLTHKGKALGADDYRDEDALGSSDEDEGPGGALGREIVKVRCVSVWVGGWVWWGEEEKEGLALGVLCCFLCVVGGFVTKLRCPSIIRSTDWWIDRSITSLT